MIVSEQQVQLGRIVAARRTNPDRTPAQQLGDYGFLPIVAAAVSAIGGLLGSKKSTPATTVVNVPPPPPVPFIQTTAGALAIASGAAVAVTLIVTLGKS